MCGLFSFNTTYSNGFTIDNADTLLSLFYLNQLRGADSTGICYVDNLDKPTVFKVLGSGNDMINHPDYNKNVKQPLWQRGKLLFGHGRAATKGTVTIENAHPFIVKRGKEDESLILAHNGTLASYQGLPGFHEHDVDSSWIASILAKEGPEVLGKINGAMALIWFDQKEKTINFFRNSERPLHVAVAKGAYYVASEDAPLAYIRRKYNLGYKDEDISVFNPMMHVALKMKDLSNLETINDLLGTEIKRSYVHAPINHKQGNFWNGVINSFKEDRQQQEYEDDNLGSYYQVKPKTLFPNNRTLESDIARMRVESENLIRIEFKENKRTSYFNFKGTAWETEEICEPYEKNLWKIEKSKSGVIAKVFRKDDRCWFVEVPEKEKDNVCLLTHNKIRKKDDHSKMDLCINQAFKSGKKFSFHTKVGNETIRHKGMSLQRGSGDTLSRYENDIDGHISLGERITIEIGDVENSGLTNEKGKTIWRIIGYRLKQKMDSCIDVVFHTAQWEKEEIEAIGLFRGKISQIRICTNQEYANRNSIVSILLGDPTPVPSEDMIDGKANEQSQKEKEEKEKKVSVH